MIHSKNLLNLKSFWSCIVVLNNFNLQQQKVSKENEDKAIEIISKQKQKLSFYTSESENLENIQFLYWVKA